MARPLVSQPQGNNKTYQVKYHGYYGFYDQTYGSGDYHIAFFYEDGTVFYPRIADEYYLSNKIDSLLSSPAFIEQSKQKRTNWGIYTLEGTQIKIEKWELKHRGPTKFKTYEYFGEIKSNGTIVFNRLLDNYWNQKVFEIDREFTFREFRPKPDSTNRFIE
ncbi:MAG: hypothetical protein AAF741_08260 [Bacteroidota bacterium]